MYNVHIICCGMFSVLYKYIMMMMMICNFQLFTYFHLFIYFRSFIHSVIHSFRVAFHLRSDSSKSINTYIQMNK